jgi:hypothetical protein
MPLIPSYESTEKPLGESRNVLANPAAMSAGWRGVEALGSDIGQLGAEVGSAIQTVQDRQNKIAAHDAANQYQKDIEARKAQAFTLEGDSVNHYSTMSGKDEDANTDLYTGENAQLAGVRAKYVDNLQDPRAREMFNQFANDIDASYRSSLATHQASETRAHNAKVVADTFDIAKQSIVDNPSDDNIGKQIARVKDVIAIHHGKADTELAEKMEADLRNVAKNRKTADKVTTETVALQREAAIKFPDDPVKALDYALDKVTGPDWREDAMGRGIDETAQQRIVSQLSSSLVQQDKIHRTTVSSKLDEYTLLLDGNGLDSHGKPIPEWEDKIHNFIYDPANKLNGDDKKKFLHMKNEKIDRELKVVKDAEAEKRREESDRRHLKQGAEHIENERRRLKMDKEHEENEKKKQNVTNMKADALRLMVSGEIKDNIDIINKVPGMDSDTFKGLVTDLKEIKSSKAVKDGYSAIDAFVKTHEQDAVKQKTMMIDLHDQFQTRLAGKTDPAEVKQVVDNLMKEKDSHHIKDAITAVGNFFKPKDSQPAEPKTAAPANVKAPPGYTYDAAKGYYVNPSAPKGKKAWRPQ